MTTNTLQPGRDLDALVAEKVMSLPVRQVKEYAEHIQGRDVAYMGEWVYDTDDPMAFAAEVPHYSTDIAAAWQVVEHFNSIRMDTDEGYQRRAKFIFAVPNSIINGTAAEAAYTICLAALKAVGAEPTI